MYDFTIKQPVQNVVDAVVVAQMNLPPAVMYGEDVAARWARASYVFLLLIAVATDEACPARCCCCCCRRGNACGFVRGSSRRKIAEKKCAVSKFRVRRDYDWPKNTAHGIPGTL